MNTILVNKTNEIALANAISKWNKAKAKAELAQAELEQAQAELDTLTSNATESTRFTCGKATVLKQVSLVPDTNTLNEKAKAELDKAQAQVKAIKAQASKKAQVSFRR